jgi:outer membrane biosynthesis protein TonB
MITSTGQPASATLLSSSGSREADQYALAQAKAARFDPLPGEAQASTNPVTSLNWARLVFEWQTVPPLPASPSAGQP